jgi:hypothetical protein
MSIESSQKAAQKAGTASRNATHTHLGQYALWGGLIAFVIAILATQFGAFSLSSLSGSNTSIKPDSKTTIIGTSNQVGDFNEAGVPNWWLDFSAPKGKEKIHRQNVSVQACTDEHVSTVWGGASSSGPVQRDVTITTLEGASVAIPADAIVCTAGPRGSALVLATGSVYAAYALRLKEMETQGTICPSNLKAGQKCGYAPTGRWLEIPNTNPSACLRYQGADPNGTAFQVEYNIGKDGYPADNQWVTPAQWMEILKPPSQKAVKAMRFASNTGLPEVVIYEYRSSPSGCYY